MTPKAWFIALLSFGLLLAALMTRNGDVALMALPFLAYLGAGIWETPSLEALRLNATRVLQATRSGGATTITVRVTLRHEGRQMVSLRLADPLQPGMKITRGDLRQWVALEGREVTQFEYDFESERGSFRWQVLQAVAGDSFGLFESELAVAAPADIQVQPRINQVRPFLPRPDSTLHSPGSVLAHRGGSGTDFWGVREYHPGDPMRRLDWRLMARHPRQFFSKEFEQEESADIGLILDARQRSDIQLGNDSLFEHTIRATASLADAFLHQGHRVSLLIFGGQMRAEFPGYGKVQRNRILRALARAQVDADTSGLSLGFVPLRMFASGALIVVLSTLAPDDASLFPRLRARGNQVLLICPDPIDFARLSVDQDPAGRLALRAARVERHLALRKIAQLHVRVIDWQVDRPLAPLVRYAFHPARGERR